MRICIHRSTREIGGTCVELESQGARILLDRGLRRDGDPDDESLHPNILGLAGGDDLVALILSHGHLDHFGLAHLAGCELPVALRAATHRILRAAAPFVPRPWLPAKALEFMSEAPLTFGPFRVTPFLVDHSAYDAYALLMEAGGQRLLYSGDPRAHGRKVALFERLMARPPGQIDILLMEGSCLGRLDPDRTFPTEVEIEARFVEVFRRTEGVALVAASAQNIDRMVSLYRACKRVGRALVIDLYAAEILRATANSNTLEDRGGAMTVVFLEARHFSNKDLRADPSRNPQVIEQIERYRRAIARHESAISESYRDVCQALRRFEGIARRDGGKRERNCSVKKRPRRCRHARAPH